MHRLARHLLDESAQHRAWTHLNIGGHSVGGKAPHRRLPPDRRRHLADERGDRRIGVALRLGVDVGDDRHARVARPSARAAPAPAALRAGCHQRAVERRADLRAESRAWRRGALARSPARATAAVVPGDHHLARRIEIGRAHHLAFGRLVAGRAHRRLRRGPARRPSRRGRPARPPACSGRGGARCAPRRRRLKVPAATCAEYSPRLCPATTSGRNAARLEETAGGDAHRQDRRLRDLGEREPLGRAVEDDLAQARSRARRRLPRRSPGTPGNASARRPAHADRLRSLPGKDERDHRGATIASATRCSTRASTPSADEARRRDDGVADRLGRRAAVTDQHQPRDAEQRRAAVLGVVDALAEAPEGAARQQVADLAREGARQLRAQQLLDHLDQPLAQLRAPRCR